MSLKLNYVINIKNILHVLLLSKKGQGQYSADRPSNCCEYSKLTLTLQVRRTYLTHLREFLLKLKNLKTSRPKSMLNVQSSLLLFVANPIEDIQMVTEPLQWQHVSKGENAVDLCPRAAAPDEILETTL